MFLWDSQHDLEKKNVEVVSRARILEPNVGAERETERKKEGGGKHPFVRFTLGRSRSPPTIAVKNRTMRAKERHFFFN